MKLRIKETCIVAGGRVVERGDSHETASEAETYQLIASGRAVVASSQEATEIEKAVAVDRAAKAKKSVL